MTLRHLLRHSLLALALAGTAALAQADTTYHASIDTHAFSGTGWLDFALIPGQLPAAGASVTLSNFSGAFGSEFSLEGDAGGSLASGFTLGNASFFNDLFHAVTLGGNFSFDITIGGAFETTPGTVGTTLGIGLLAGDQFTYLGNPDGNLFQFELTPMLGQSPGRIDLSVLAGSVATVSAVPEPSQYALLIGGLAMLGAAARRRAAR